MHKQSVSFGVPSNTLPTPIAVRHLLLVVLVWADDPLFKDEVVNKDYVFPSTPVHKIGKRTMTVNLLSRGRLKRSARAVQLFGRLAVLETHTFRY